MVTEIKKKTVLIVAESVLYCSESQIAKIDYYYYFANYIIHIYYETSNLKIIIFFPQYSIENN